MVSERNLQKPEASSTSSTEQKMDQKTLLQKKKPISVITEAEISIKGSDKEKLLYEKKAALEETIKNLHEQVACLLCECNAKDELMAEHVKTEQEAIIGKEKAEAEVAIYKQELEDTLQQNIDAYERLVHLNASLKNCKTHLTTLKIEQDERVGLERAHKRLESKYIEARKKLANLTLENALLAKSLVKKDQTFEKTTSEYFVLKKEVDMRRTLNADVANWKQQESTNLEAERQKLRLLAKKRIPGHGKSNTKSMDKRTSLMMKKLTEVEEENRALKESLCGRENEIKILKLEKGEGNSEAKILELEKKIVFLEMEVERVKELKRRNEDQIENLKLINIDLEHQLSGTKVERKEALRKVSVLEMELEDRSHQYEGLEAACLELQLQLATVSSSDKEVRTELSNNKKLRELSSLRDHMAADDSFHREHLASSPMIKEILNTTDTNDPRVQHYNTCKSSLGVESVVPQALQVVPRKKHGKGTESLWKLLLRRKRGGNKKKFHVFAAFRYHI